VLFLCCPLTASLQQGTKEQINSKEEITMAAYQDLTDPEIFVSTDPIYKNIQKPVISIL
jgi:hypothetical protein